MRRPQLTERDDQGNKAAGISGQSNINEDRKLRGRRIFRLDGARYGRAHAFRPVRKSFQGGASHKAAKEKFCGCRERGCAPDVGLMPRRIEASPLGRNFAVLKSVQ
jgi:hypothetical protein